LQFMKSKDLSLETRKETMKAQFQLTEMLRRTICDRDWDGSMQLLRQLEEDVVNMEVKGMELQILREKGFHGWNPLHCACERNAPKDVLSKLIEIGGRDLVLEKDKYGYNPLYYTCCAASSAEVASKLIEIGGRDLVLEKDRHGMTTLHYACKNKAPTEIVSKLLEVGGRDLAQLKDEFDRNALHYAFISKVPADIMSKLIIVGGKDLILQKDNHCQNSLHLACLTRVSTEVILTLIEVGGKCLVLEQSRNGSNLLHYLCYKIDPIRVEVLDLLIHYGGKEILMQTNNDHKTALQELITKCVGSYDQESKRTLIESISLLIDRGIQLQVGGEYTIGGLFDPSATQNVKEHVYRQWDELVLPSLRKLMKLPRNHCQPILQAAVIYQAPPRILKDIVDNFPESVYIKDSFNQYPITVCAKHGLRWENGTKKVFEKCGERNMETEGKGTGLYLFMLAALGGKYKYDLGSVFHLIKNDPRSVRYGSGEKFSKKRKRE